MKSEYFFVYGSLKQGLWNHRLLFDCSFVGKGLTVSSFVMLDGMFPYVFHSREHELPISGELYKAPNDMTQRRLDILEGVSSNHYRREIVEVMVDKQIYLANIYCATESTVDQLELWSHPLAPIEDGAYCWR